MVRTRLINEIEMHPTNAFLKEADYSLAEEEDIYNQQLQHVYDNPGLYLDNLNMLREYRLRWKDYRLRTPTLPYKHTKKGNENEKLK